MLCIINVVLNEEFFFKIVGYYFIVVEVDVIYVKFFKIEIIVVVLG